MITSLKWQRTPALLTLTWFAQGAAVAASGPYPTAAHVVTMVSPLNPVSEPYVHTQASAATVWTVNHNLGRTPASVRVLSAGGIEIIANVIDVSQNQLTVNLAQSLTGSVQVV